MRTRWLKVLSAVLPLLFVVVTARAEEILAKADIPFAFEVGNTALPAGTYTIGKIYQAVPAYLLRDMNGAPVCFVTTLPAELKSRDAEECAFVFDRVGDRSFLRKVLLGWGRAGLELPKSKHEHELLAQGKTATKVEVAEAIH